MDVNSLREALLSECAERPWGCYVSTFGMNGFKTKILVVKPRQRLSLQSHEYRRELWTVISGRGICTVDDKVFEVEDDSFVAIPMGARHRIENVLDTEDLIIAEVQIGDHLSENDIIRYEDDYGRGQ